MVKLISHRIRAFFAGTLRRQLIFSVALVHAALMALFVWDLTERQRDLLLEHQTGQAQALAHSVATSAAGWVAARDFYGLQEIVMAQSRYPELRFAMILDKDGRVLAHNDTSRVGLYLTDLPKKIDDKVINRSLELVDIVSPIILAGQMIGWTRIGFGQQTTAARMSSATYDGIYYAIVAILIGSILAWYMGTKLTRKLRIIQSSADAVERGDAGHRAMVQGKDEISHVAKAFNKMLDSMLLSRKELENSEERFNLAMQASNDGLYDWDLKTNTVYYSPRWKAMLGYQEHELENAFDTWAGLVDDEDMEKTLALVNDCISGNSTGFETEFRMRHKEGHWVHVLSHGMVSKNAQGKAVRVVGTHTDITDKKEQEEIIWHQANYDVLTSLPNRKLFHELLNQELKKARRDGSQLWVLFLDLDGFKEVNDTLGHHAGDVLLVQVANRIQMALRKADIVARLGGDEFVITVTNSSKAGYVDKVAEKLVDIVAQTYQINGDEVFISASIGIVNFPNDANNVSDLLKFADQSMYAAKKQGKNRYTYFTPALQNASLKRIEISADLRQGITNNEFQLYYQPIINLENDQVHKAEALIRWIHPDKGLVSPAAFIPIAEESGMIVEIGSWVFDTAFEQLQKWQSQMQGAFQLSVNMSPFQLKISDKKYDDWLKRLKDYGLSGESIVVEITEGLLLKSEKTVSERLLQYRDAKVQVAIDDFGTGYSSLSYLKEFDIDYLKIDQSFTRNLTPGSSEESLSEAIVVMAHKLGLKVIAEGIETQQQRDLLVEMGCDYGQGYLFSRPLPAEEFEHLYIVNDIEPLRAV